MNNQLQCIKNRIKIKLITTPENLSSINVKIILKYHNINTRRKQANKAKSSKKEQKDQLKEVKELLK